MKNERRHPAYIVFIIVMAILLIAGLALLIGGILQPEVPVRPRLMMQPFARCPVHG